MNGEKNLISACSGKVTEYRNWLHAHPELSGKEENTASYIANALREMGLEPVERVGGYGVVALIEGKAPGKCVGLRADFDALPIQEKTGLDIASQNDGVMHACGHDAHAAMLLGAAYVLNQMRDRFSGTVKLVFQPSEEDNMSSGAKAMIADGVLQDPPVDAMFSQHVWPKAEVGQVLVRNGAMMGASDRFYITIHGKKSHGSAPENGIDAIVIAAEVISLLQTIISRKVNPMDNAVITIGQIIGGQRYNIIADEVQLVGTCRSLTSEVRDLIPEYIESVVRGVTESMGGSYHFEYVKGYSVTANSPEMFHLFCASVRDALGENALQIPEHAALTGEDFSFFCEQVPSCYFWLGCRNKDQEFFPLHNDRFFAAEECLPVGVEVMVHAAINFLNQS